MAVQEADENDIDEMDDSSNKSKMDDKKTKKDRKLGSPLKKKKRVIKYSFLLVSKLYVRFAR